MSSTERLAPARPYVNAISKHNDSAFSSRSAASEKSARFSLLRSRFGPGRDALLVLHGIAEPFGVYTQAAQRIQCQEAPVSVERDDVSEYAAKGESLWRFTEGVHERLVPSTAVSHIAENTVEFGIGLLQAFKHSGRCALRSW